MNGTISLILCLELYYKLPTKQKLNILNKIKHSNINIESYKDANEVLKVSIPSIQLTDEYWKQAELIQSKSKYADIKILSYIDDSYPRFLKQLANAPILLHVKGNADILKELPGVSIVGTRKITKNGEIITSRITRYFSEHGWVIISGLALGVDAIAHSSTISSNGKTIAVLAGGLHEATPKKNSAIADQILSTGGAWISEHPYGAPPIKKNFVARNRIQVGLSAGSIIIEADEKSGTLTQARFCLELQRPLFAIFPDDIDNKYGLLRTGTGTLVKEGAAMPIKSRDDYSKTEDILSEYRQKLLVI